MENKTGKLLNGKGALAGAGFSLSIVAYVVLIVVGGIFLTVFTKENSLVYKAIASIFAPVSLVTVTILMSKQTGEKVLPATGVKKCSYKYFIASVLLAGGMFLGLGFFNTFFAQILTGWGINVGGISLPLDTVWHYLLFILLSAVLPAVTEETLYRGFILNNTKHLGLAFACLMNGLIFALYHWSLGQLIYQFIYGVMLTLLAYKSGSVIPSIIAHFLNNLTALTLTYFSVGLDLFSPIVISVGVGLLVGFILLIFLPIKKEKVERDEEQVKAVKKERVAFLITSSLGIVVSVIYIVINAVVSV